MNIRTYPCKNHITHRSPCNNRLRRLIVASSPSFLSRLFSPSTEPSKEVRGDFKPSRDAWSESEAGFVDWLTSHGVSTPPLTLQPQCEDKGRGLAATARIKKGTRVITVPLPLIITPSSALPLIVDEASPLSDWSLLSLALMDLKHDQSSSSYLSMLPPAPGSVLDLEPQEFNRLFLQCSSPYYRRKAERILEAAEASIQDSLTLIDLARAAGRPLFNGLDQSLAKVDLRWALSICLSRAIRLETTSGSYQLALVPWADLLNHDSSSTSFIQVSKDGCVAFTTDRDYEPGDEVMASYGAKSSLDLLLSYGFSPDPVTNPHHCYHLPIELDANDHCYEIKMVALQRRVKEIGWLGLAMEESSIPIKIDGFPQELLNLIAFIDSRLQPSEVEEIAGLLFDKSVMSDDLRLVALNGLKRRCKTELTRLSPELASLAQKQVNQKQIGNGARELQWREMLAKIRERDRQILQRVEYIAASEARQVLKKIR